MTANERIRELRKTEFNMNMEDFGRLLGISKSGVSEIESGRRNVTEQHIQLLTSKPICGKIVSEAWLRDGKGEMFVEQPRDEMIQEFVDRALAEEPPGVRRWVLNMLTEFSDGWWDEIEEVLRRIKNREIGPYADLPDADPERTAPAPFLPGSPEAVADAEALYERTFGIAPPEEPSASNTSEENAG